jgi:serine/threonine protein phosphatase PrpC
MDSKTSLNVDGLSDIGNRRQNNEDAWWAGQLGREHASMEPGPAPLHFVADEAPVLLLVSDGVGGANAGEVASQMAVTLISGDLSRRPKSWVRPKEAAGTAILSSLQSANATITAKAAEPGFDGMGATLSLVCFVGGGLAYWGQVGDSRIYLCRRGSLRQISRDHSPVGRMRQQGKITEAEARQHPLRNQIDQSLGDPNNPFRPDTGTEEARLGDVFLLCSDGLSDGLWDHEIEGLLAHVRTAADVRPALQKLIASAKQASGRDNITAVAALVESYTPAIAAKARPSFWSRIFGG